MGDWLDEAQARCDAATPGPWAWQRYGVKLNAWVVGGAWNEEGQGPVAGLVDGAEVFVVEAVCSKEGATVNYRDAAFIAHAREDLPRALAALRRWRAHCKFHERRALDAEARLAKVRSMALDPQTSAFKLLGDIVEVIDG